METGNKPYSFPSEKKKVKVKEEFRFPTGKNKQTNKRRE